MNAETPRRQLTVRVREACRMTGIGRTKFYELIQEGEIEVIKVGTMTLVLMASLEAFLDARRASSEANGFQPRP